MMIERSFNASTSDGYGWKVSGLTDTISVKPVEAGMTEHR